MTSIVRGGATVAAILSLAALAAGCGKASQSTGPIGGDAGGVNLLVYRSDRSGPAGQFDIWLYDVDEAGFRGLANLNSAADESEPTLSNDGALVAFASNRAGGSDLYVYDRASAALVATPNLNTPDNESWPRFAYDSVRLAFVRDSAGFGRVRLYEPQGDTLIALPGLSTGGPLNDTAPAPDLHGDRIAFQTDRAGNWDVMVWNRAGGLATLPDLASAGSDVEPSLSSNGRWLAFASDRAGGAGGFDIYLYDLVNSAFVPLPGLNTGGEERHPAVSLSGNLVYFQARATPADSWGLYQYAVSTHALTQPVGAPAPPYSKMQPYARVR